MKLRSTLFSALVALALVACGGGGSRVITPNDPGPTPNPNPNPNPQPQPTPPTLTITKIMAFGDSLTEGESLGQLFVPAHDPTTPGVTTSYPFKLDALLKSIYTNQTADVKVYNLGAGGERVVGSQAKDRLNTALGTFSPDVLLLLHGVNNVNATDPILTIVESIEELVELAYARGVKQVFIGNLPPQIPTAKATGGARIAEFNSWLPSVAAEEGATLVDIHSNINTATMLMADGLHLNETGNVKLAELFYAAIKAKYHREPGQ